MEKSHYSGKAGRHTAKVQYAVNANGLIVDKGYLGAQEMYEDVEVLASIRRKPGKKLSDVEKAFNRLHSKIRVYVEHAIRRVKTWRIMGDRYRNQLKKYDRINDVVCGLANQRLLWLAEQAA